MRARVLLAVGLLLAAGCGGGSTEATPSATPSPTPTDSRTIGLLAIGHSGLTGYASGSSLNVDVRENSWATGTNPVVNSIYQRLIKVAPEFTGKVENVGVDGSTVDAEGGLWNAQWRGGCRRWASRC